MHLIKDVELSHAHKYYWGTQPIKRSSAQAQASQLAASLGVFKLR
jgi:hypothetical protein